MHYLLEKKNPEIGLHYRNVFGSSICTLALAPQPKSDFLYFTSKRSLLPITSIRPYSAPRIMHASCSTPVRTRSRVDSAMYFAKNILLVSNSLALPRNERDNVHFFGALEYMFMSPFQSTSEIAWKMLGLINLHGLHHVSHPPPSGSWRCLSHLTLLLRVVGPPGFRCLRCRLRSRP